MELLQTTSPNTQEQNGDPFLQFSNRVRSS